ncbi:hypothetical protein [Microcystis aeruginosa]|uniref:hypothetical protein n=1 Tax=Microcystis aeruginosa TaxID=1126 RepID=UPI003B52421A
MQFCQSSKWGFLRGNSLLKLGFTFDFITQSKLLGGSTPQTPRWGRGAVTERVEVPPPNPPRISFSVGCLQAAADASVII